MAEQPRPPTPPTIQERSKAIADAFVEAEERQIDETVPGGRYLLNGRFVNAEGEPLKDAKKDEDKD